MTYSNNVDNFNRDGEMELTKKLNVEDRINNDLTEIVQAKWEKIMNETGGSKLAMPIEYFSVLRVYFQLAYQEGQTDMIETLKEVYHNNPDHFEYIFDEDFVSEDESDHDEELDKDEQGLVN